MVGIAISSDVPLMIGALSAALSGLGTVVPAPSLFDGSRADVKIPVIDVMIVDPAPSITFADIQASAVPQIAKQIAVVLLLPDDLGRRVGDLLGLGIRGLLPRSCSSVELTESVTCVLRGALHLSPALGGRLAEHFVPGGSEALLTPREREVLDLLAQSCTYAEIAAHLLLSRHTVKFHVSNVLAKLGVRTGREAVTMWVDGSFGPIALPDPDRDDLPVVADPRTAVAFYGEQGRGTPAPSALWRTT